MADQINVYQSLFLGLVLDERISFGKACATIEVEVGVFDTASIHEKLHNVLLIRFLMQIGHEYDPALNRCSVSSSSGEISHECRGIGDRPSSRCVKGTGVIQRFEAINKSFKRAAVQKADHSLKIFLVKGRNCLGYSL